MEILITFLIIFIIILIGVIVYEFLHFHVNKRKPDYSIDRTLLLKFLLKSKRQGFNNVDTVIYNLSKIDESISESDDALVSFLPASSLVPLPEYPEIPEIYSSEIDVTIPVLPTILNIELPVAPKYVAPIPKFEYKIKLDESVIAENESKSASADDIKAGQKYFVARGRLGDENTIGEKRNEDYYKQNDLTHKVSGKYMVGNGEMGYDEDSKKYEGNQANLKTDKVVKIKKPPFDYGKVTQYILSGLKYTIGVPLLLICWYFAYQAKFNLQFYSVPLFVYLLIVGYVFYKRSGALSLFEKPKMSAYGYVIPLPEVNKVRLKRGKIILITAYFLEFLALFIQSLSDYEGISNVIGFVMIGVCALLFAYAYKRKKRYLLLLSIYVIAVELTAKVYDIFSKILQGIPFWSYILLASIILLDITFYVLSRIEKKESEDTVQKITYSL